MKPDTQSLGLRDKKIEMGELTKKSDIVLSHLVTYIS